MWSNHSRLRRCRRGMFYDLNIPWPGLARAGDAPSKKSKKNNAQTTPTAPTEEDPVDPLAKLSSDEQLRLSELTYELKSRTYSPRSDP